MKSKQPDLGGLFDSLQARFGARARANEPLAPHVTLRLGCPADVWFPARSAGELAEAASLARQWDAPVFVLGSGANLLIGPAGIRGLVIQNNAATVQFAADRVTAESGTALPRLANQCAQRGLSGLEWAAGVPGTVGGAVVNNAGAFGSSIADCLIRAQLLAADGRQIWRPVEWFEYGYRASKLKRAGPDKALVLQAELAVSPAPAAEVTARMQTCTRRRKASQPPGATAGSMFKNPPGDFAGRLIEAAGLKGYRIGGAQISPRHANFFINHGNATAADVLALADAAQQAVFDKFGIRLELEIEVVNP
ncbi:MAG: UDP-N-acetylmuramate dehydrogenase [Anaerolineae bacterium]